jgi:hypothetical protein
MNARAVQYERRVFIGELPSEREKFSPDRASMMCWRAQGKGRVECLWHLQRSGLSTERRSSFRHPPFEHAPDRWA